MLEAVSLNRVPWEAAETEKINGSSVRKARPPVGADRFVAARRVADARKRPFRVNLGCCVYIVGKILGLERPARAARISGIFSIFFWAGML